MEFDTGPDVQPGHEITYESSSGPVDLGEAGYDSDHDGVADSVIVIQDGKEYVVTDADQDGTAESLHAYDSTGQEVDPKSGAPLDRATPDNGNASGTGDDSSNSDPTTGSATGADAGGTSETGSSNPDDTDSDTTSAGNAGHYITVTRDDGSAHSVGAPTVDLDKDGSPDTAVVHNSDGSISGYTDRDGDGSVDQITQIDPDGKVVIAVSDGNGGWEVAATGRMDGDGTLVEDSTENANAGGSGADDRSNTGHLSTSDVGFTEPGEEYEFGHPTTDLNGDGTADTVVTQLSDGTVVGYSDSDGDGTADQVAQISPDGRVMIGISDGRGGWQQAATGHLGADGTFVPDGGTTAFTTAG